MRQIGVQFLLFGKRLLKRPVYLIILLLMPLTVFLLSRTQAESPSGIRAMLYVEGRDWNEREDLLDKIIGRLLAEDATVRFTLVESEEELKRAVLKQEADCGYVFPEDFSERLRNDDWKRSVTFYCGEDTMIPMLVNELLYTSVFQVYSADAFIDYMGTAYGEEAGGRINAENKAEELLNLYLTNGSTFSFAYYGESTEEGNDDQVYEAYNYNKKTKKTADLTAGVVPVRGMLALFMMLSAFCGLVDHKRDHEAGRFVWVKNKRAVQFMMILIPTTGAALVSLLCIWASGSWQGIGMEIASVIFYMFALTAYTMIWGLLFRSEHAVVASVPFLMIATILFCPVFWNLKSVLPVLQIMEKLFPVSWYLAMV